MKKMKKITACPHCGSKEGFYTETDYIRVPYMLGYNGEEKDNSAMYENAITKRKRDAYCIDCGKKIGTANRMMMQLKEAGKRI